MVPTHRRVAFVRSTFHKGPHSTEATVSSGVSGLHSVAEWLESDHLSRCVRGVAARHGVLSQDAPDILQDVCISLLRKGADAQVNATWIFKVIGSKIIDYHRKARRETAGKNRFDGTGISLSHEPPPELGLLLESRASLLAGQLKAFYVLRYRLGLKLREVERRLGIS